MRPKVIIGESCPKCDGTGWKTCPICLDQSTGPWCAYCEDSGFVRCPIFESHRVLDWDLEQILVDARNAIMAWGAYADKYYQDKWNLEEDVAHFDALIAEIKDE